MKIEEVFCNTFKAIRETISPDVRKSVELSIPSMTMVEACRADDFDFFAPFIATGKLTVEQMRYACQRYYLGKTKSGQPIFWMIDDMLTPLDAHIGSSAWMSTLLKAREPLIASWQVTHCLFGLHLLTNTDITFNEHKSHESHEYINYSSNSIVHSVANDHRPSTCSTNNPSYSCDSFNSCSNNQLVVCVVESVRSCVVLSELFPEYLWMATGYLANLNEMVFLPLKGHHVVCFPATDPTGDTYLLWLSVATEARKYGIDITVSRFLEDHASPEQKAQEIDLVDYLFDTQTSKP